MKKVGEYFPISKGHIETLPQDSSGRRLFNRVMGGDYLRKGELEPGFIERVTSDARDIMRISDSLEDKVKVQVTGNKITHLVKTLISKEYRNYSAKELFELKLKKSAAFRDLIGMVYSSMESDLNRNEGAMEYLEMAYIEIIKQRDETLLEIQKTTADYELLKNASQEGLNNVQKAQLRGGMKRVDRSNRKAGRKLDELNHRIFLNAREGAEYYLYGLIFENNQSALKKIYDTVETETRKIENLRDLYLKALETPALVEGLEGSFKETFDSLRRMDNLLISESAHLMSASSITGGEIGRLSREHTGAGEAMLETLREGFVENATELNTWVERYIKSRE
jgi:hypothetical protein